MLNFRNFINKLKQISLIGKTYPIYKFFYHRIYIKIMKLQIFIRGEEKHIKQHFIDSHNYEPNLKNPSTFSEKLAWTKLYTRNSLMTQCADKYAVRDYVKNKIGKEYLIPLLGVFKTPEEIDFKRLKAPFVLKVNHTSGGNCFSYQAGDLDEKKVIKTLNHYLKINAYYYACEWAYKDIEPLIVCEELLFDEKNKLPDDYKFFCFNGKPEFIQVDIDRFGDHKRDFYSEKWDLLPTNLIYQNSSNGIKKPMVLDEMLRIAEVLSNDFDFARVDLYVIKNKIFFGEITFYPEGGSAPFSPSSFERTIGKKLKLQKNN